MPESVALHRLPTSAIAYVLGLCMGQTHGAKAGRISALIAELKRRGDYDTMCSALDPQLVAALTLTEGVDRGRAWTRTRRRPAG